MLGAEPSVDYSLANRTLLFDLDKVEWSDQLVNLSGLERSKLPRPVPSGTVIGEGLSYIANVLGLPPGVVIVAGAHDQFGKAFYLALIQNGGPPLDGGDVLFIIPVYEQRKD